MTENTNDPYRRRHATNIVTAIDVTAAGVVSCVHWGCERRADCFAAGMRDYKCPAVTAGKKGNQND
jgi:hypothetical protein